MNRWVKTPHFKVLSYSDGWEITKNGIYEAEDRIINIPAGFQTNLASIPRLFRSLISVNGKHRLAACLHDYLYSKASNKANTLSREAADKLFLEEMKRAQVKLIKRYVMYKLVVWFGKSRYKAS